MAINQQILDLIKTEDGEYISIKEKEKECTYEFDIVRSYEKDSNDMVHLISSWDVPINDYYIVVGNPVNEYFLEDDSRTAGYELNYLISLDNKIVIMMPHQGGCHAYKIKDNKKTAIYPYLQGECSCEWR